MSAPRREGARRAHEQPIRALCPCINTNSSGLCQSIPRRIIGAFEARACLQSARHAARQSKFILRRELRVMDRAETVPPPTLSRTLVQTPSTRLEPTAVCSSAPQAKKAAAPGGRGLLHLVNRTGLEPVTFSVSWRRASQLRQRSVPPSISAPGSLANESLSMSKTHCPAVAAAQAMQRSSRGSALDFPTSTKVSQMGGLTVEPDTPIRSGCATAPIFPPACSLA